MPIRPRQENQMWRNPSPQSGLSLLPLPRHLILRQTTSDHSSRNLTRPSWITNGSLFSSPPDANQSQSTIPSSLESHVELSRNGKRIPRTRGSKPYGTTPALFPTQEFGESPLRWSRHAILCQVKAICEGDLVFSSFISSIQ